MMSKIMNSPTLKRIFRGVVALGVPAAIQYAGVSANPAVLLIAPALNGLGKWLRDKYNLPNIPV